MDAKSAKKNGDAKKLNRDDRQNGGAKVEELAEKVDTIVQLEFLVSVIGVMAEKVFTICGSISFIRC